MNRHAKFRREGLARRSGRCTRRQEIEERSDTELAAAAADAIDCLTTVPLDRIRVRAQHGWLRLEGTVNWDHQRTMLEEVTRPLAGVRGVTNEITIQALPVVPG